MHFTATTIALIVLSSILLLLIVGLIFKKDFRQDILKAGSDNEAEFKGLKIKGALFWVIYAATAFGTIYLGMKDQSSTAITGKAGEPFIEPIHPDGPVGGDIDWVALDLKNGHPIKLQYGAGNSKDTIDHTDKTVGLELALGIEDQKLIVLNQNQQSVGDMNMASLQSLRFMNQLNVEKYFEIKYNLTLSPFDTEEASGTSYDWIKYENLPFSVKVSKTPNHHTFCQITDKETDHTIGESKSLNSNWLATFELKGKIYVVRLSSKNISDKNKPYHAEFQILQCAGDIEV